MTEEMKGQEKVGQVKSEAGTVEEHSLEVTRREFMRRAAMVSGLAGFTLLGADALLEVVLQRMQSVRGAREVARFVSNEAGAMGFLARAHADVDAVPCSPASTYCSSGDPHYCDDHKTGTDFNCTGFRCDTTFDDSVPCNFHNHDCGEADHSCSRGADHGCGVSQPLDFNCSSVFQCDTDFKCAHSDGSMYNFACVESGTFKCTGIFTCLAYFSCVDEGDHHGCEDSRFQCGSQASFSCDIPAGHYKCDTPANFDGLPC